jgi:chemotaxis methyl-accepting protein methylase
MDVLAADLTGAWDVILCRNMTIYLEEAAARELWDRLARHLAPGGLLVTGKAEQPGAALRLRGVSTCIYQKQTI